MKAAPITIRFKQIKINNKIAELEKLVMQILRNPDATAEEVEEARQYLVRNKPLPLRQIGR
jgi:hypothetical protein